MEVRGEKSEVRRVVTTLRARKWCRRFSHFSLLTSSHFLMMSCAPPPPPTGPVPQRMEPLAALEPAAPLAVGMHPGLPAQLDSIIEAALADGAAPGAVVAVGRHGRLVHLNFYGRIDWARGAPAVDAHTIFDLASVTKVVGTTTAAMLLEEQGVLDLDRRVVDYLPAFSHPEKAPITLRMLLEHRAGLEAFAPLHEEWRALAATSAEPRSAREWYLQRINERPLRYPPGTETIYSDWDLILLQLVVERLTGQPLDRYLEETLFAPLGMRQTMFNPPAELRPRIAATEVDAQGRSGLIHGEVHDPNAWALGGVAGHAGLFSTAADLAVFAQMMLNGGEYNGVRIVRPQTAARWTAVQRGGSSRAFGWDTPGERSSAGRFFSPRSFGHTGYTGTSMWLDPERGLFAILLTNRVNPTSENMRHVLLRRAVADAVQSAILDAPLIDWETRRN
jgi:CubicO group peptidase (beta-lactamase class C family)